jgi:hypothetical protein
MAINLKTAPSNHANNGSSRGALTLLERIYSTVVSHSA